MVTKHLIAHYWVSMQPLKNILFCCASTMLQIRFFLKVNADQADRNPAELIIHLFEEYARAFFKYCSQLHKLT